MPTVCSIIVVTLNEVRHLPSLKKALDALKRPGGVELETILVDGGSIDGTPEMARQLGFHKVIVLPGAAIPVCRNRGLAEACGDWVAFLDGDCEPLPDWLAQAAAFLNTSHPRIIGWPVEPPGRGTWVQRAWHTHWLYKNRAVLAGKPVHTEAFRLITTRNMLLTRSVLEKVPAFDEQLVTGEDTDFVFRAHTQGIETIAVPALRVIHHGEPKTLREFHRQQLWHANRSSYLRIAKTTGGKVGGNVIWFTLAFLAAICMALAGFIAALAFHRLAWSLLAVPLVLLLMLPAILVGTRARRPSYIPALMILYGAYGLARVADLLGWGRHKKSWKTVTTARADLDFGRTTNSDTPASP
jgi:GT2 family glycosyltransferase